MNISNLSRGVLGIALTVAMLAGCSQAQTVGPGMMPQSAPAGHAARGTSWMLPETKGDDLLYISDLSPEVRVYSYPGGKPVGVLNGFSFTANECADSNGNVYITNQGQGSKSGVYEYAHGGTTPINFIPYDDAFSCSVDLTTDDLAVVGGNGVSIYTNPSSAPTNYTDANLSYTTDAAYDSSGNLFVNGQYRAGGFALLELPKGGDVLRELSADATLDDATFGSMLWDGQYLVVNGFQGATHGGHNVNESIIYRVQVEGSQATVVGTTTLGLEHHATYPQFWIQGHTITQPSDLKPTSRVYFWSYPSGRREHKSIKAKNIRYLWGTTISVAGKPH